MLYVKKKDGSQSHDSLNLVVRAFSCVLKKSEHSSVSDRKLNLQRQLHRKTFCRIFGKTNDIWEARKIIFAKIFGQI
jgi:hypothetical protein